jgi:hypothetical protein
MGKTLMSLHLSSQVYLYRITYKEISIATWTKDVSLTKNKKMPRLFGTENGYLAEMKVLGGHLCWPRTGVQSPGLKCFLWTPDTTLGRWNTWMRRAIWGASTPARHVACCVRFHPKPVNMYYIIVPVEAELKLPVLHCETYVFSTNVYLVSVEVWLVLHHPCRSVEKIMFGGSCVVFHDDSLVSPVVWWLVPVLKIVFRRWDEITWSWLSYIII